MGNRTRKRALRVFATGVMVLYTVLTLFPFYALTIRSFVSTKDSADLHLWIPKADEVNMNAQVGNLGVFYDLDLADLKDALDIPQSEFIMSRTSLLQISEQYDIPEERIRDFFKGFYTYNGWRTLTHRRPLRHNVLGSAGAHIAYHRRQPHPCDYLCPSLQGTDCLACVVGTRCSSTISTCCRWSFLPC